MIKAISLGKTSRIVPRSYQELHFSLHYTVYAKKPTTLVKKDLKAAVAFGTFVQTNDKSGSSFFTLTASSTYGAGSKPKH